VSNLLLRPLGIARDLPRSCYWVAGEIARRREGKNGGSFGQVAGLSLFSDHLRNGGRGQIRSSIREDFNMQRLALSVALISASLLACGAATVLPSRVMAFEQDTDAVTVPGSTARFDDPDEPPCLHRFPLGGSKTMGRAFR
jgi:hypothetical protein